MAFPNYTEPVGQMVLDTDASDVAIGGCISQYQKGILRPLAFGSKSLSPSQQRYGATQRELFALVYFVEYWRHYLLGHKFIVRTDESPLRWLRTSSHSSKLLQRWLTILENAKVEIPNDILSRSEEYDFEVIHRTGKQHANADSLSRCPNPQMQGISVCSATTRSKNLDKETPPLRVELSFPILLCRKIKTMTPS